MAEVQIIAIDLDDLDPETRELFKRCMPVEPLEPFDIIDLLTDEVIAGAMVAGGLVSVH